MRNVLLLLVLLSILATPTVFAQTQQSEPKPIRSFDIDAMDKSIDPCTNFFEYSCGNWIKQNPIPADQTSWGRFDELNQNNRLILRDILEKASVNDPKRTPVYQQIGDFYAACMDEAAADKKGIEPVKQYLDRINALKTKAELPEFIADAHKLGLPYIFEFSSMPDPNNAAMEIAQTDQSGLGLPERDYYLRDDAKSVELRKQYLAHVQKLFELAGDAAPAAAAKAKAVLDIETELAKVSMDVTSRRDPQKLVHIMPIKELAGLSPDFDWNAYLKDITPPSFDTLNVAVPDFVKGFDAVIQKTSLDDLKAYFEWQLLHYAAPMLSQPFVNENFAFFHKTMQGQAEIQPRWKRCVSVIDGDIGEALGQAYVDKAFGPEAKQRMLVMVHNLEEALNRDISDLPWMTEATRKQALIKLSMIDNKIGYPDKWRDYSSVKITRDDLVGNDLRSNVFEVRRQLNKIGKPTDRKEWGMTPPTVNAYYNPFENNVNFPAGILQPPFFDMRADDAVNYGAIGAVIGHELTHGFDDQGRQFDGKGNLRDWWTAEDAKAFEQRAQCIVDEYSSFTALDDLKVNGKLTLGENTADNGGLRIALMALSKAPKVAGSENGFTPEQRAFLGWGQIWCESLRPEYERMLVQTNPHSPPEFRVNGVVSNMPEFGKAFGCKQGQPMVRQNQCRVW